MELDNDLITRFAKITQFNKDRKDATTVRGVVRTSGEGDNTRTYIQLDGAEDGSKTPAETTVEVSDGDRVIAAVKDHSVIITGNRSNPSVGTKTAGSLRSEITQTAEEIRLEVADTAKGLSSTISQTAGQIRSEVNNSVSGLNSKITQTADAIRSEVSNTASGLNSKIEQTASEINQRIENLNGVDGSEFTEFKQTVEGFYFIDDEGTVFIDGGSIYAKNLELTGAITWSDLSTSAKNKIDSVVEDAISNIDGVTLPDYITETYIDGARIESPTIVGGTFYAVGTDFEYDDDGNVVGIDGDATFASMDDEGFYVYHKNTSPDLDSSIYPKLSLTADDSGYVYFKMGSGEADNNERYNRFIITKGTQQVNMYYYTGYYTGSGNYCGFTFDMDNWVVLHGELHGSTGVFPVGYIYLSYDDTISPASLFGGSWKRLEGYFLYAGGSSAVMGSTGNVVTAGGTNSASYIKIAAWRRVS